MALNEGEKYLTIQVLGNNIKLAAFPNKNKTTDAHPDFKGDGVAVWVNVKKKAEPKAAEITTAI